MTSARDFSQSNMVNCSIVSTQLGSGVSSYMSRPSSLHFCFFISCRSHTFAVQTMQVAEGSPCEPCLLFCLRSGNWSIGLQFQQSWQWGSGGSCSMVEGGILGSRLTWAEPENRIHGCVSLIYGEVIYLKLNLYTLCPTILTAFFSLHSIIQSSFYYLSIRLNPASIHSCLSVCNYTQPQYNIISNILSLFAYAPPPCHGSFSNLCLVINYLFIIIKFLMNITIYYLFIYYLQIVKTTNVKWAQPLVQLSSCGHTRESAGPASLSILS